jgi:glutamyl-tRNA synthetase
VAKKMTTEDALSVLQASRAEFEALTDWATEALEAAGRRLVDQLGLKVGQVFMTLRIAVTGSAQSPPLFESMEILGKVRCLARLDEAIHRLS